MVGNYNPKNLMRKIKEYCHESNQKNSEGPEE